MKKNWKNFLVIQSSVIHFEWLLHCLIPCFFSWDISYIVPFGNTYHFYSPFFSPFVFLWNLLLFTLFSFFLFAAKSDISCKLVATNKHSLPQPPTSTTSASKSCSGNNSQEPTALATLQFLYIINDDTPYTDTRDTVVVVVHLRETHLRENKNNSNYTLYKCHTLPWTWELHVFV